MSAVRARVAPLLSLFRRRNLAGLSAAVVIAIAADFLSQHYGAPAMLFALLLGIAVNFLSVRDRWKPGIDAAASSVLRIGVMLLGLRISAEAIAGLGAGPVLLVVAGVIATILAGLMLARIAGKPASFGCLSGGSVAICGASAALALASVLPQTEHSERDTIVTVTALSTVAMVVYPLIAAALGLSEQQTGIFLGATIHDVAQVVGAGYSVSGHAGDVATVIKLMRVAMLLPVIVVVLVVTRRQVTEAAEVGRSSPIPWFIVGFAALVLINNTFTLPAVVLGALVHASRWCIVVAVAALGMKTSFGNLVQVGYLPVAIICAETVFLCVLGLAVILMVPLS